MMPAAPLSCAYTHRDHAVLQLVPTQRMHHGGGADGTGGAQRDGPSAIAPPIGFTFAGSAQRIDHRQRLRRKRFVQLVPANVIALEARITQRRRNRFDGAQCP